MAKDKKSKKADKKARVAQRQEKKAAQKEKKQSKKGGNREDESDIEDIDLDAVLAAYAKQQEQFLKVTETVTESPSPRSHSTLIASPENDRELFLFGGEYFNGALAQFYNDLFIYNINRDEWKLVTSPNSPLPRSGHAWCRGGNVGGVYLFGGEFSSPKQGTFYHYNDFWRLDPASREWTRLESKGKSPPARSGHRMTYFKNYIILFGGFQDTSQQTKYLQDLWIYDCTTFTWHEPKLPLASGRPEPRSSFSLLPHESGAVLYGGYSRVKVPSTAGRKHGKSGFVASKMLLKPLVHQDTWSLRITPPSTDAPSNSFPTVRWERRKRPANTPNPPRAGATMCAHKGRGIQFGGVHDVEESEEGIESEFFNSLFVWNVDKNRFFPLTLRRPRTQPRKQIIERGGRRERGRQAEEELLANLRALEMKGVVTMADDVPIATRDTEGDNLPEKPEKTVMFEMPHPRFNAQLAVQNDILYIFGGTFEKGDREYTLDEFWAIDLVKLDGVKEIHRRELEDWQGSEEEESNGEDEEEDSSEEEESDLESCEVASIAATSISLQSSVTPKEEYSLLESQFEESTTTNEADSALSDTLPHPRPFEYLRDFYIRTSVQWQELVMADMIKSASSETQSVKEVKKKAFEYAEEKWWDCREEIRELEDEQAEAGIGDIISLTDKAGAGSIGGVGRRR